MRTPNPAHKTTIRYTWNRRIAMLLACILLFHAVFAGVEVHAQDTPDHSQTAAQTAAPIPADSYTIDFDKTGAWDGYAQYSVTIWDTTTGPLENTALAAQWQDVEIDTIWGATAQKIGNIIYILPLEWSTTINPGSPLTFGIIIKGNNQDLNPPEHIALFPIEEIKSVLIGQMLLPPWEEAGPTPLPSSQPGTDPVITGEPSAEPNPAPTETPAPTTPTPVPTVTPTQEPTPSPKPTTPPHLTLEIAETQSATYGYTNPPQTSIRITNTGEGISASFTLELAAGQDSPFTLTPPVKNVLAGAEQTTITLTLANGLDAGLYTDSLTLHIPGQEDQTIPVLQQVNKLPVLEPAVIRIASITTDTLTLSQIPGYEYAIAQQPDQPSPYQDSPVFTGLQPDTDYTLLMRKKETENHTAGQITSAQVHTSAIPAPEPTPALEPTSAPEPTQNPDATATPEPVEDLHVNGSLTLTQNTICRNLYMNGTSLDLNGYNLTVQENLQHTSGTIYAEKAGNTLTVQENYTQDGGELHIDGANVTIGGNYEQNADSYLFMCGSKKDTLTIQGSWLVNTTSQNRYNYGTIRLHGNLTRTKNACQNQIQQDNDTRIYLQGTAPPRPSTSDAATAEPSVSSTSTTPLESPSPSPSMPRTSTGSVT